MTDCLSCFSQFPCVESECAEICEECGLGCWALATSGAVSKIEKRHLNPENRPCRQGEVDDSQHHETPAVRALIEYHRALLADELRTRTYRQAIRSVVRPGDVVLDLGCGSGVLSFFACEAGAAKVYAIEQSHMADVTRLLARRARLDDRIEVFHEESSKVELPQRADVLITETIGSFGFDENILSSVIDAKARLLRPGATILPRRLTLSLAPVELIKEYEQAVSFWSEAHFGIDFSSLRLFASSALFRFHISEEARLADGEKVIDADLAETDTTRVEGRATYRARRDGLLTGFAVWFTATLAEGLVLSNHLERGTHWSQGFLPLETPISLMRGAHIDLEVDTDDGKLWNWRGTADGTAFDQTSGFSMPPCGIARGPRS